jgi:hypothetical protein
MHLPFLNNDHSRIIVKDYNFLTIIVEEELLLKGRASLIISYNKLIRGLMFDEHTYCEPSTAHLLLFA